MRHEHGGAEADAVGAEQHQLQRLLAGLHSPVDADLDQLAHALLDQHVLHRRAAPRPPAPRRASGRRAWRRPVPPQPSERWSRLAPALTPPMHTISTPWVATYLSARVHLGVEVAPALDHQLHVLDRVEVVVHGRGDELVAGLAAALVRDARARPSCPGSWPPLPGFAPCANFTSASAARAAVMGVTVKRAPAYWMLRLPSRRADAGLVEAALAAVGDGADAGGQGHARARWNFIRQ